MYGQTIRQPIKRMDRGVIDIQSVEQKTEKSTKRQKEQTDDRFADRLTDRPTDVHTRLRFYDPDNS
jgi:hypothetical protein